jgi:hypothetical protein
MANEHRCPSNEGCGWEEGPILGEQRFGRVEQRAQAGCDIHFSVTSQHDRPHLQLPFQYLDEGRDLLKRPPLGYAAATGMHNDDGMLRGIDMMHGQKR